LRNHHSNTKYVLMQMFNEETKSPYYRPLCEAKNFRAVAKVFDMEADLDTWIKSQQEKGYPIDLDTVPRKAGEELAQQQEAREKRKLEQVENDESKIANGDTDMKTKEQDSTDQHVAKKQATNGAVAGDASLSTPADTPQSDGDVSRKEEVVATGSA
jgi:tRNA-dihydrouridine synthase 2